MEFGVDLDHTFVDLLREMTWNFYENPFHIFTGDNVVFMANEIFLMSF